MVFTLFHPFISFLFYYPFRRKLEIITFLTASMLPDIESLYYVFEAIKFCGNNFVCLAEFPSHQLLHSFLGIILIAFFLSFFINFIRKSKLTKIPVKILFLSSFIGGLTHLLVDLTVHKGADALALFFPLDIRFSFIFPHSQVFWISIAFLGFVYALYLLKKNKLLDMVKP